MLRINVLEDGCVQVTSDDANAENIGVQDALEGSSVYEEWAEATWDGEELSVIFAADAAEEVIEALESEFPREADEALAALKRIKEQS